MTTDLCQASAADRALANLSAQAQHPRRELTLNYLQLQSSPSAASGGGAFSELMTNARLASRERHCDVLPFRRAPGRARRRS